MACDMSKNSSLNEESNEHNRDREFVRACVNFRENVNFPCIWHVICL
jgi:hypothetical protein